LPTDCARDGLRAGFANPTHRHAHVLAFDDDDHAARLEVLYEGLSDIRREALLNLRPACVDVDKPSELAQTRDAPIVRGDVPDVGDSVERDKMVLTRRVERDVLDENELFVIEVEGHAEDILWRLMQAGERLRVRTGYPLWGVTEPAAVRVLSDRNQNLADGRFYPHEIHGGVEAVGGSNVVVVNVGHGMILAGAAHAPGRGASG